MKKCNLFEMICAALPPSGTLTTLHSFRGGDGDGPRTGLTLASDGSFYGTASNGGGSENCLRGCGTVFKITPQGVLTRLHVFDRYDGETPESLVQASDGNFYGTTNGGGVSNDGTIFRITPVGTLTTLHSFAGADGSSPYAGLLQAANGDFYGTTNEGGANNNGTAFRLPPSRTCPAEDRNDWLGHFRNQPRTARPT